MEDLTPSDIFIVNLTKRTPAAMAWISGNEGYPELGGRAEFYRTPLGGIIISVEVFGLPDKGGSEFYGMHIHEFGNCSKPFDKTGNHYNPLNVPHPEHPGDLPPLLSNNGYAWMAFYDNRFNINEIIGKSIVIHGMRDDFNTQPSGDSGMKIGCGAIMR